MFIIPAIDLQGGEAVRLLHGDYNQKTVYSQHPEELAKNFERMGAKYLHVVDLDGAKAGETANLATIEKILASVSIPVQLGGGVRNAATASLYLDKLGVNRVILGTVAVEDPAFVREMIQLYGEEKIAVSVDARDGRVATRGWLSDSGMDYLDFIRGLINLGTKYIVATDILRDGALAHPNFEMYENIAQNFPEIKTIVSGGISCADDIDNASPYYGVIVGRAYYEGKVDLELCLKKESSRA